MANSFSILLSYIDNLLWLCTQLFYGILLIIDFNYKLVTTLYRGFVQLWGLSVQVAITIGNAFVSSIEFLAELPVKSFHLGNYLLELVRNLVSNASQAFTSWFWVTLANGLEMLTAIFKNLGLAFISVWTKLFDLLVFHSTQLVDVITSQLETTYNDVNKAKANTVHVLHSVGSEMQGSVLGVCNVIFEYFITVVTYPIAIFNACTKSILEGLYFCVRFFKAIVDSSVRIFEDLIEIVYSSISSIANGLYYIMNTLTDIATFCITVIDCISQTLSAFFYSAAESYLSISSFMVKNWGALLALALCVTLVWVTINMTRQHDRNIFQDLIRFVKSFTHYLPHAIEREPVRPEGHLHHDIRPQGQQRVELQDRNEENGNTGAGQDLPVGLVGEGDQPGPSRPIHTLHSPYLLRSRPFTPLGEPSGRNNPIESTVSDLKHKLSKEQERKTCVVCLDAVKDTLFLPCRHLCVCLPCADKIVSNADILSRSCPLCRTRIGSIVEVYS
eukprot:XP_011679732.1 PREDICTED: uncharacterized protein LOC105445642 [Strongylocentrotus purpuratus]